MRKTEILMDGLTFGEGPRWHDGKFYFSDFYSHKVFSLDMKGNSKLIVEIPNQPSGLGWLSDGTMLIVSMKDRKLMSYKNNVLKEVADLSSLATALPGCQRNAAQLEIAPELKLDVQTATAPLFIADECSWIISLQLTGNPDGSSMREAQ